MQRSIEWDVERMVKGFIKERSEGVTGIGGFHLGVIRDKRVYLPLCIAIHALYSVFGHALEDCGFNGARWLARN